MNPAPGNFNGHPDDTAACKLIISWSVRRTSAKESNGWAADIFPDESDVCLLQSSLDRVNGGLRKPRGKTFSKSTIFNSPIPAASASFGCVHKDDGCATQIGDLAINLRVSAKHLNSRCGLLSDAEARLAVSRARRIQCGYRCRRAASLRSRLIWATDKVSDLP
jgi:hypothetical protein